jgi:hypothetical protein
MTIKKTIEVQIEVDTDDNKFHVATMEPETSIYTEFGWFVCTSDESCEEFRQTIGNELESWVSSWLEMYSEEDEDYNDPESEYKNFVASMTYGAEMEPITVDEATYNMEQWKTDGMCIPKGLTAEKYAEIWNAWYRKGAEK